MLAQFIVDILFNIIFISVFIGIFFFTYAKHVEENIAKKQGELLANNLSSNLKFLSKDTKNLNIPKPDLSNEDDNIATNNQKLQNQAFFMLGLTFITGLIIIIIICKMFNVSFWSYLRSNLIILFFIALCEYLFLTFIASNYISVDPNYLKYRLLSTVKDKIETTQPSQPSQPH